MRWLHPSLGETVDLDAAYWVEDPGAQHASAIMISSLDGAAQTDGRSGGLGNAADEQLFALHRAHADVILVGAGTARVEEYSGDRPGPEMRAIRARRGLSPVPRMAIVTNRVDLSPTDPLFTDTEVRPLVITSAAAPKAAMAALRDCADVIVAGAESVDLAVALDELRERGLIRVSCEGGPNLLAQVIAAGRLDELRLTMSPNLLAGDGHRITTGPTLVPPHTMELVHILEDEGYLFLRYRAAPNSAVG